MIGLLLYYRINACISVALASIVFYLILIKSPLRMKNFKWHLLNIHCITFAETFYWCSSALRRYSPIHSHMDILLGGMFVFPTLWINERDSRLFQAIAIFLGQYRQVIKLKSIMLPSSSNYRTTQSSVKIKALLSGDEGFHNQSVNVLSVETPNQSVNAPNFYNSSTNSVMILLIAAAFLISVSGEQPAVPVVHTALGEVRGFSIDTQSGEKADVFLNIPFAEPPVGELRFEKPRSAKPWNTPLNATTWGHECVPHTLRAVIYEVDEDCLTVNVIRPQKRSRAGQAVLLWVHGGGYEIGSARLYGYQGFADAFAHRDVIVVSLQYRIGVYGFLSTGDNELPGNLGLWDLTLGLKWVHDNIVAFGGDPNKITLWGLSAGGAAVNQLVLSPHSRDFVASAVEMSGSAFASWAIGPTVVNSSQSLIKQLGCVDDVKTCLKTKTVKEINDAVEAVGYTTQDLTIIKWGPRIDGDFFPSTPDVLVKDAPPKPVILGVSDKDSSFFTVMGKSAYIQSFLASNDLFSFKEEEMTKRIGDLLKKSAPFNEEKAYDKIIEHYLEGKDDGDDAFYLNKYTEFITDTMFNAAAVEGAEARIKADWPVWIYSFAHYNDAPWEKIHAPKGARGSFHINEFTYMFDMKVLAQWAYSSADIIVKENLRDALANFAHHGVPVWNGTRWPQATENLEYLIMQEHAEVKEDYHGRATRFWRSMKKFGFDAITLLPVEQKGHEEL